MLDWRNRSQHRHGDDGGRNGGGDGHACKQPQVALAAKLAANSTDKITAFGVISGSDTDGGTSGTSAGSVGPSGSPHTLQHLDDETFQVSCLRHTREHRMVRPLSPLFQ